MANINLLKNRTGISPELAALEAWLLPVSFVFVGAVFVAGVALLSVHLFLQQEQARLEQEKSELVQQVTAQRTKEGLLISVKHSAARIEKVQQVQQSMGGILDVADAIALNNQLLSIVVDEQQQILVVMKTVTVEDAAGILVSLMDMTEMKRVVNPKLVNLEVAEDGSVYMTVSFVQGVVG